VAAVPGSVEPTELHKSLSFPGTRRYAVDLKNFRHYKDGHNQFNH